MAPIWSVLPYFLAGAGVTLAISMLALVLGLGLGAGLAAARLWGGMGARGLAAAYVSVVRGTPCLVQLLLIAYGLPQLGLQIGAFAAGCIGLGLNAAAYMAEVMRAAVLAVPAGQTEAAQALGLPPARALRQVVLPQAARLAILPLGAQIAALVKASALVGAISVVELTQTAQRFIGSTYRPFEMTALAGLGYLAIIGAVMVLAARLNRRFAAPGCHAG